MRRVKTLLLQCWDLLLTAGPVLALAIGLVVLAYRVLDPNPPRTLSLATGPAQSAYAEFGQRYAQALRRQGITVTLRESRGSQDNLALLQAGEVDAAFVQGGAGTTATPDETPPAGLVSLSTVFREPVWVFYRRAALPRAAGSRVRPPLESLSPTADWRINVGPEGSGVPHLMRRLLRANGLDPARMRLSGQDATPAVVDLLAGRLDALVLVSAPESPLVRMLLITPGIGLLDFTQAEAYARRIPQISPVSLPRGVVDLARDLPAQDVSLLAANATLVVRDGTHPALQQLLVQAADRIHGEPNWFQRKGEFPRRDGSDLPLAAEAQRFFDSGAPLLQRHLPFWLANLIDRMWVVLVSIVAVLIPLTRVVPPLYDYRIRSRIFRWYGRLREIEDQLSPDTTQRDALLAELNDIDARVEKLPVPLSYAEELYALRSHIQLVRRRLLSAAGAHSAASGAVSGAASGAITR